MPYEVWVCLVWVFRVFHSTIESVVSHVCGELVVGDDLDVGPDVSWWSSCGQEKYSQIHFTLFDIITGGQSL